MSQTLLSLAGFQVILIGRFWVIAEGQADPDPASVRDTAILGLLYGLGLRRTELVRLDVADFHCEDGLLAIRGKGKHRIQ